MFEHLLLNKFGHVLDLSVLPEEDKVLQSLKVSNAVKGWDLTNWALAQLWQIVLLLLHIRHDVLHDLLHEHTIVTLGSHSGMGTNNTFRDCARQQVAASTASFSADRSGLF